MRAVERQASRVLRVTVRPNPSLNRTARRPLGAG
jgi:hypothetical protein